MFFIPDATHTWALIVITAALLVIDCIRLAAVGTGEG